MDSKMAYVYSLKKFWPEGLSVQGVYLDNGGPDRAFPVQSLGKARKGLLRMAGPDGALFLLQVASSLTGRKVELYEIVEEVEE
jgi:hypothetical protein